MIKDYIPQDNEKLNGDESTDYISMQTYWAIKLTLLVEKLTRDIEKEIKKMNLKDYMKAKKEKESKKNVKARSKQRKQRRTTKQASNRKS